MHEKIQFMVHITASLNNIKNRPGLLAFFSVATFIASLYLTFEPRFETNDDVMMSMIAHGYGIAAYGSPQLVYSNVLWGYLIRSIPSINGILGYSIATILVLLVIGWVMLFILLRLGKGYLLSLLLTTLVIAYPALFPQFTMNAGLLTVTAILGWQLFAKFGRKRDLGVACLLAFFGYLIRDSEFFLVMCVASPLLPWTILRKQRQMQIAFLLLGTAIVMSAVFDHWSYQKPEWQQFKEFNTVRIPFTDYGAGEHIKRHPEITSRQGFSTNDIDLLSNWFFIDPKIANPIALSAMLKELGPLPIQEGSIQSGLKSIELLNTPALVSLLVLALFLFMLLPRRQTTFVWGLCLLAFFTMGILGRPGISRVYFPLISLLLIIPIYLGSYTSKIRQYIILLVFIAWAVNAYLITPLAFWNKQWAQQVQKDTYNLSKEPTVIWGGGKFGTNIGFPYVFVFPVLSKTINIPIFELYGLNPFTLAPFSMVNTQQKINHSIIENLQTTTGIRMIGSPDKIEMLRIYCNQHLNAQLYDMTESKSRSFLIHRVRCEKWP
ncbi:MAG: hypothetical protein HOO95_02435 [Gallionella sp.]|nr:hypothetical protein [Gallionella sp.]